jgi:hypothetical protein
MWKTLQPAIYLASRPAIWPARVQATDRKGGATASKVEFPGEQVATTPPAQMPLKQRWWAIPLRRRALGPCLCVALPLGNGLILDPDRSFLSPTDCFGPGPSSQPVFSGGRCVAHGRSPGAHVLLSPNQSSPRRTNTWNSVESSQKKRNSVEFSPRAVTSSRSAASEPPAARVQIHREEDGCRKVLTAHELANKA